MPIFTHRLRFQIALLLPVVSFIIDWFIPQGFAGWLFYFLPLLFLSGTSYAGIYVTTAVCSVMLAIGAFIPISLLPDTRLLVNRLAAIPLLWALGWYIGGQNRLIEKLRAATEALRRGEERLQERARELADANRDLESFSYSVAHDLRNPLLAIHGFAEILAQDYSTRLDDDGKSCISRINQGTERMNSIIDDILALSKISRQEMKLGEVHLHEIARTIIDELRSREPDRRVTVVLQGEIRAWADAQLLNVALGNLLGNAWKYTAKTGDARIEFGSFAQEGRSVFFVKDNGAGFDMSKADKLFKPFSRLHGEKEFKGTGVGLAIAQRAIARHGGTIWAQAEVGKGATFYFTLHEDRRG
jgi:signal transduction histidine kinase